MDPKTLNRRETEDSNYQMKHDNRAENEENLNIDLENDNSKENYQNQGVPQRKNYNQKVLSKKQQDQKTSSEGSEDNEERKDDNRKGGRPVFKQRELARIKENPKSGSNDSAKQDDDESEEDERKLPKPRKEYQKKVLKKLPYHAGVQEIDLSADKGNQNSTLTKEEMSSPKDDLQNGRGNDEEEANQSWFFPQKVLDNDFTM